MAYNRAGEGINAEAGKDKILSASPKPPDKNSLPAEGGRQPDAEDKPASCDQGQPD